MKTNIVFIRFSLILFFLLFMFLKSNALDYNISFAAKGENNFIDSVVIQNLTKNTIVTVPAGSVLYLSNTYSSIDQLTENRKGINVFSNSLKDKSTVLFFAKQSGVTQIDVFSLDGKKILCICKYLSAGDNSFQLSLPKGYFAIKIVGNGYFYAAKVMSQGYPVNKPEIEFIVNEATNVSFPKKHISNINQTGSITPMRYAEGDRLLYKGFSGNNCTVIPDVPKQSKTITFTLVDCTDPDGNHYPVVQIGTQTWMVENLKTTKYRNGDSIGTTTPATKDISSESTPKYQWAYNGDESNAAKYGRLYTWYAVSDNRNLAPQGWHVPTDAEWTILKEYLIENGYSYEKGGDAIAQSLAASTKWEYSSSYGSCGNNLTMNNSSGFSALPAGLRRNNSDFLFIGSHGYWYSSTVYDPTLSFVFSRELGYEYKWLVGTVAPYNVGISVRCVRDPD